MTHAAMEVSSHGLEQHRADGIAFSAGAFTNLTQDHLDYHHTMGEYRAAKLKLWALVKQGGPAIVNADSSEGLAFETGARARGLNVINCGWRASGADDLKIVEIQPRPKRADVDFALEGQRDECRIAADRRISDFERGVRAALALSLGR